MSNASANQVGYTLIELIVTVTVIAVIAAIAVPAVSPGNDKELQVAAAEFAAAIRFARTESMRTAEPHGFRFLPNNERIRVFSADTATGPWTMVFDTYHPVTKQLYDYTLPSKLWESGNPVTSSKNYRGSCDAENKIYFDANGTPWCLEPETVLLEFYQLDFVAGNAQASVHLDGITGRVTVQ